MNMKFKLSDFELVIFDWDGTLINSIDWIVYCLQKSAIDCGLKPSSDSAAKNVIGLSIQHAMQNLFPDVNDTILNQLIHNYSEMYFEKELSRDDLFNGVYDFLVQLKQTGYLLAVATGKTRKGLNEALLKTNTKELFVITRCADETASKPNPKMLTEILEKTGICKEKTLFIGDSIHDMAMAKNAGICAIAVSCGANTVEELQAFEPLCCLKQVTDLTHYLG